MITQIIPAAYNGGSLTTLPRGPHPGPRHAVPFGTWYMDGKIIQLSKSWDYLHDNPVINDQLII